MKKKPVKIWIVFLVLPIVLFFVTSIAQFVIRVNMARSSNSCARVASSDGPSSSVAEYHTSENPAPLCDISSGSSPVKLVVNIFSLLVGIVAVLGILGTPLWIIFLVQAVQYNNKLEAAHVPASTTQ